MKPILKTLVAVLSICLTPLPVLAVDTQFVEWSDLVDATSQDFEDPFRDLTEDQIHHLRSIVRSREKLAGGSVPTEDIPGLQARLDFAIGALTEAGIDADWLISQRRVVAGKREDAANAANPAFDGQSVSIAGFAIPAPPDEDGTPTAYLVEQRGMCSHTPPPLPNQLIRVRLVGGWRPSEMHEPVRLVGHLHIDPGKQTLRVVDGDVSMDATWRLDANGVETISGGNRGVQGSPDWVTQLRAKLKSNSSETPSQ